MTHWKPIFGFVLAAAMLFSTSCASQNTRAKGTPDEYSLAREHMTIVNAFRIVASLPGPDQLKKAWASKDELAAAATTAAERIQKDLDENRIGVWCISIRPKNGTCHSDNLIVEYEIPVFPKVWNQRTKRIVAPIAHVWDSSERSKKLAAARSRELMNELTLAAPPPESQPHTDGEICATDTQYITGLDGQTTWILWGKLCVPSCDAPTTRCHWIQLDTGVLP